MRAEGRVIEVNGSIAHVVCTRSSACASCKECGSKGMCHAELIFGEGNDRVDVYAENLIGAKAGDTVEVESSTGKTLLASAAVFLLPVILSIAAYFVAGCFTSDSFVVALCLFVAFVVSFLIMTFVMNKFANSHITACVVSITEESEI